MPSISPVHGAVMKTALLFILWTTAVDQLLAAPVNDQTHNPAKPPFVEKPPPVSKHHERPQFVDRTESNHFHESASRVQVKPEAPVVGHREQPQKPQIIYIKPSHMMREPNGRPQLPHVEGVHRRYRFDDIPDFRQGQWWNERPQISQEYQNAENDQISPQMTPSRMPTSAANGDIEMSTAAAATATSAAKAPAVSRHPSCLYSGKRFSHGSHVDTPEPCLNCTCQAGVLVCYLRVCPPVLAIPDGCFAAKEPGKCCATTICNNASTDDKDSALTDDYDDEKTTADQTGDGTNKTKLALNQVKYVSDVTSRQPDELETGFIIEENAVTLVPDQMAQSRKEDTHGTSSNTSNSVMLVSSSSNHLSNQNSRRQLLNNNRNISGACYSDDAWFMEGSAMLSHTQCVYCYCLRGSKRCVRPRCVMVVPGCLPKYGLPSDCCPLSYDCEPIRTSTTSTTTDKTPRTSCLHNDHLYEVGNIIHSSEPCQTCVCTQDGIKCAPVECPLTATGCEGIIPKGHCCPTEYVCDTIRNMNNETEQLKIIPDRRPGSVKETHMFRKIDGPDTFESYLTTTTASTVSADARNQKTFGSPHKKQNYQQQEKRFLPSEVLLQKKQTTKTPELKQWKIASNKVNVDSENVDLSSKEASNLFYVPEIFLQATTTEQSVGPRYLIESSSNESQHTLSSVDHQLQQPHLYNDFQKSAQITDSPQPIYVPKNQIENVVYEEQKTDDLVSEEPADKNQTMESLDSGEMASTSIATYATYPQADSDADTKLSKFANNKKSTFTVNLGSHITVAYDSAEVTTEGGITTAKNSEFSQQISQNQANWNRRTASGTNAGGTTTELPRPTQDIFTLQEKQDNLTPTESSVKLTRKQGDDITTIPGLIISTPSSLLQAAATASSDNSMTSKNAIQSTTTDRPSYIITTSDVINNEVKFRQRTSDEEETPLATRTSAAAAAAASQNSFTEPTVQSSSPSKSIYRSIDSESNKKNTKTNNHIGSDHQRKVLSPSTGIDFAEGVKLFSTLLLSGLAKSRNDHNAKISTSSTTSTTPKPNRFLTSPVQPQNPLSKSKPFHYSSPIPIPITNYGETTQATAHFFIPDLPAVFQREPEKSVSPPVRIHATVPNNNNNHNNRHNPIPTYNNADHNTKLQSTTVKADSSPYHHHGLVSFLAGDAMFKLHKNLNPSAKNNHTGNDNSHNRGSGCFINGATVSDGETITKTDPCMLCRCYLGEELCTLKNCPPAPGLDCVQEDVEGSCCPRYTCKPESVTLPSKEGSQRFFINDGFHQPNHPKYVPHIDIMITPQDHRATQARTISNKPNSKQEFIALQNNRKPAIKKKPFSSLQDPRKDLESAKTLEQESQKGKHSEISFTENGFTTVPTATLKALLQHAVNSLPSTTIDPLSTKSSKTVGAITEVPFERPSVVRPSIYAEHPRLNSPTAKPTALIDTSTTATTSSSASSIWNLLKISGCNIYGKYYRVNEVVTELTERCKVCTCTTIGVHCIQTC